MQTLKDTSKFGRRINIGATVITATLLLVAPLVFTYINMIQWLFLAIACAICILPMIKPSMNESSLSSNSTPCLPWLGKIILFEVLAVGLFISITAAINIWQPAMGHNLDLPFHFQPYHLIASLGVFPWAMIAIITVAMRHHNDTSNQSTNPMSCCPNALKRFDRKGKLSAVINVGFQESGILTLVLSISSIVLLIAGWLLTTTHHNIITGNSIIGTLLIILSIVGQMHKKIRHRIFSILNNKIHPLLFLAGFIAGSSALLFLSYALIGNMPTNTTDTTTQWILRHGWQPYWQLFQSYWWIGLATIAGPYFARISTGRSLPQIITAILLLPLVFAIITPLLNGTALLAMVTNINMPLGASCLIGIASLTGLLLILFSKKNRPTLMFSSLPQRNQFKPRSSNYYISRLILSSVLALGFITSTGILFPTFFILAHNSVILAVLICMALQVLMSLFPKVLHKHSLQVTS